MVFRRFAKPFRGRAQRIRNRRRRAYRKVGSKPLKGFTRQQSATIRRAIGHGEETKYQATQLLVNQGLDPAIHTPGTDILPLVPAVTVGTAENQRIGRKISPFKCYVDINVSFSQTNPGTTSGAASQSWANHIYVVMYMLRSKVYKNWNQYKQSTQFNNLLDNGDGTSTSFGYIVTPSGGGGSFWTADTRDLMKPVEQSEYTLIKKKVVKLTKNYGTIDVGLSGASVGGVPNLPTTSYKGRMYYRLPQLEYDDTAVQAMEGYPTNANVVLALGWCYADNLGTYGIDGTGQPFAPDAMVCATVRNHVWFKDG